MIEMTELRIGNWVDDLDRRPHRWTQYDFFESSPDFYHGAIPLTPEILDKAGFADYGGIWRRLTLEGGIHLTSVELIDGSTGIYMEYSSDRETLDLNFHVTKYLHQLQNLYYALTGTELKIEL